jgi:hypothetical protein
VVAPYGVGRLGPIGTRRAGCLCHLHQGRAGAARHHPGAAGHDARCQGKGGGRQNGSPRQGGEEPCGRPASWLQAQERESGARCREGPVRQDPLGVDVRPLSQPQQRQSWQPASLQGLGVWPQQSPVPGPSRCRALVGVRVELLDPPTRGPVTGDQGCRASLRLPCGRATPEEEGEAGGSAEGGGTGPADASSLEEMGETELPMWESKNLRRQQYALNRNHEGKMDNDFVFSKKPHLPLSHKGEGVPWKPPAGLTH